MNPRHANLYFVKTIEALEALMTSPILEKEHIYCGFQRGNLQHKHLVILRDRKIKSVSFDDAHTIYPNNEFTQLRRKKEK